MAHIAGELGAQRCSVGVGVPQPHGVVVTAGGDPLALGAERHAPHDVLVAGHRLADGLAGVGVPQPYGVVVTAGGDPVAVGAECHAVHHVLVAGHRLADGLAGVGVPQPYPAPGTAPAGDQPDPAAANSDDRQSGDPVKLGRVPGAGPGVGDDPDIDADALDDPGGGLQQAPLSGGAQPLTAMMSMIPGLLGGVVGAAAAIPKALAQQGQSVLSQAVEGVSGLANGFAKPDPDTDVGGAGTGDSGGSAGSGVGGGGGEGGATQPAAGPNLSPSGGTGMMSVAGLPGGSAVAGAGGPPPGLPDAGPGVGGAPMMMSPMGGMGGMGGGAGGGGSRPVKAADKEVLVPPVPNGEPVRGEVLRRRARASVADAPGHSGSQDDVVVTSARSGKRVVLDKDG